MSYLLGILEAAQAIAGHRVERKGQAMARGKRVTRQTIIGEGGIALIHTRITEMGYLFHPRRVDHGIDGHIDLVDRSSGEVLNLVLLVQSKASTLPFTAETETSFRYTCDEADLNYWMSGNAPVILVLSHPAQAAGERGEAWWVDIKAEFTDPRRRADRSVTVDKRRQIFDASAAQDLLSRALPKDSGLFLAGPPKQETLDSNLLPLVTMPTTIFTAPAAVTAYRDAGELLANQPGRSRDGWILRDGLAISFGDLTVAPLAALCAGDVERHPTADWADSDDIDTQRRFAELLGRAFETDWRGDLRWHNSRKHLHFRATATLRPRREGKAPRRPGRTVFGPYTPPAEPDTVAFYRHAAITTRFRRIDGIWYCQIGTDYCFTRDGYEEHPFADTLLAKIKRLDRHAAVAGWTRTWATFLTNRPSDDTRRSLGFGDLTTFEVDRGIADRLWGPAPTQARDEELAATAAADIDAELSAAGLDTVDLSALDDDGPVSATTPGSSNAPVTSEARRSRPARRTARREGAV